MSNISFRKCSIQKTKIDNSKITNIELQNTECLESSFFDTEIYNLNIKSKYTLKECFDNNKIITKLRDLAAITKEQSKSFVSKINKKEPGLTKAERMV